MIYSINVFILFRTVRTTITVSIRSNKMKYITTNIYTVIDVNKLLRSIGIFIYIMTHEIVK